MQKISHDRSQNPQKRLESLKALVSQPDAHTHETLLACLIDKVSMIRAFAAAQLVELYDGRYVEYLIPLLADDGLVTQQVIKALRSVQQDITPILHQHLSNSDPLIRAGCASILGAYPSTQGVDQLIELLHDADVRVRLNAATSLGSMKNQWAAPALLRAMDDRSDLVGRAAVMALGDLKDESVLGILIERLSREENRLLKQGLVYALGESGSPQAVRPLLDLFLQPHESEKMRDSAALALIVLGDEGKKALRIALNEGDDFAQQSARVYLRL